MLFMILTMTLALTTAQPAKPVCSAPRRLDGRCGPKYGNATCVRSPSDPLYSYSLTECCSSLGYCGNSSGHCSTAICDINPCSAPRRIDGRCGPSWGWASCIRDPTDPKYEYSLTECCSPLGFCGNTTDHCKQNSCHNLVIPTPAPTTTQKPTTQTPKPTTVTPAPTVGPTPEPTTPIACTFSQPGKLSADTKQVLSAIITSADSMIHVKANGKQVWSNRLLWVNPNDGWNACRSCLLTAVSNGYGTASCSVWALLANFKAGYN
jgi:hypothetical protein